MDKAGKKTELLRSGAKLPRRVVPRQIEREIIPWLKREEIIVITGARQTGKSVLLYRLIYDQLLPKTSNIFYFNLDVPGQIDFFDDPGRLVDLINRSKSRTYIFIDEIQRLKEPGMFLKGLYDLHLPAKFIVSGSSTLEIKSKVQEALTGRKVVFHLQPFNLLELSQAIFPGEEPEQTSKSKNKYNLVLDHYF
ncbi:MAG: AAA family ATPase, partial [Candidatus Auribacterota bacterium]|nr:AAA family ATPase [Candidatus Auribacterota bacterium]